MTVFVLGGAQTDFARRWSKEGLDLFEGMLAEMRAETTFLLSHIEIQPAASDMMVPRSEPRTMNESRDDVLGVTGPPTGSNGSDESPMPPPKPQPIRRPSGSAMNPSDPSTWGKVPRNTPCPCGSGRKYKHCHGKMA